MLYLQLGSVINFKKYEVDGLYKKHSYDHRSSKLFRKQDLIILTFTLIIVGVILYTFFGELVNKLILEIMEGTKLTVSNIIINLNLFGVIIIGLKALYDSIIRTYLVHSIIVKIEHDVEKEHIYQYLRNEWGIDTNV
jgi:hypothetical protein